MAALLVSAHLIDFILAFTIVEGVFLSLYRRRAIMSEAGGRNGRGERHPGSTDPPRSGRNPAIPANGGIGMRLRVNPGDDARAVMRPSAVVLLLLPGICLLLAVRAALAGAAWPWMPAALTAALVAHLVDLRERWRR